MHTKRQQPTRDSGIIYTTTTSSSARIVSIVIPIVPIIFSLTMFFLRRHAMDRLDRNLTPMYGTAWLGECARAQRDATHEQTRPPGERLIVKQPTPRPNDPYPGIQEVSADERLAGDSGEVREMEASQMGAGVWPNSVRRKSVMVNEEPVELGEVERERELRSIVV